MGREGARAAELLSPQFSRGLNAKKLFRLVRFRSARTGTLATQARVNIDQGKRNLVRVSGSSSSYLGSTVEPALSSFV